MLEIDDDKIGFDRKMLDKEWRKRLRADPVKVLREENYPIPNGFEVIVVTNSRDTLYIPLNDINVDMSSSLSVINAAGVNPGSVACLGSVGTMSCFGTACGTLSTGGTSSSISSASSAGCT